jgi:hypothetical protein
MNDLPSGFLRQRRNLIAISLAFLVFEIGGGTFEKLSFPVIGITLENESVAIWGAWIAMFYFIWRYWLYSEPIRKDFHDNCLDVLVQNIRFKKLAQKVLKETHGIDRDLPFPSVKRNIFRRSFDYGRQVTSNSSHEDGNLKGKIANAPFLEVLSLEIWAVFVAMFRFRGFSDYVMPYLLAIIAIVFGAIDVCCKMQP